jgi:transposase
MTAFPTAGHLLSWAGLCPRLDESAGKRRSTRTRHGAPWLKTTLMQTAWAAARLDKSFRLGRYTLSGMLDVFNVMNSNAVTNFVLTNGPSFGQIISALDPRTAQVALRIAF